MDISAPLLCASCNSNLNYFDTPSVDPGLHESISTWLRNGFGRLSVPSERFAQISTFVADASRSLRGYDKTITEIERQLSNIKKARDNLRSYFDDAQSLISSPIRNLPLEALNEIFTWCCKPGGSDYSLCLEEGSVLFPTLRLTWVCSSWRTIIQSSPDLWSSIEVTSSQLFHSHPSYFQLFLMYLSYSRDNPLDCYYDIDLNNRLLSRNVEKAFDTLLDNSARWRRVTLVVPKRGSNDWFSYAASRLSARAALEPERLVQLALGSFPHLESIQIPRHLPWSDGLSTFFGVLSPCPRLQSYQGAIFSWAGRSIDVSHLTELAVTFLFGESIPQLVCRLPTLLSVSVEYVRLNPELTEDADEESLEIDQGELHYSSLVKLQIPNTQLSSRAWSFLRLPSLMHLQIDFSRQSIDGPFFTMLADSQCKLQTLRVRMTSSPLKEALLDFIAVHPTLVTLSVDISSVEVLRDFTEHLKLNDQGGLAPHLSSLELGCKFRPYEITRASLCPSICEMIESRCAILRSSEGNPIGISGLQALTLVLNHQHSYLIVDHFIHTHLSPLEEAGLQVDLHS
ncbi:hypothetical protein EV359DRAFT_81831 [Lentinula novae-zelandiae]|nr:hypothetical protein EV359DRAFT_81831 [Lentinula novae-zelandiae]